MNRSKRSMPSKLQKKMAKAIRSTQGEHQLAESLQYRDELTLKEILKKHPKSHIRGKETIVNDLNLESSSKKKQKIPSKRTTPGQVQAQSSPAHVHMEGKRWIKTLIKQNLAERATKAQRGSRKK